MAQNGKIVFFTETPRCDTATLVEQSFRVMGADLALNAWRTRHRDQGWKELKRWLRKWRPPVSIEEDDDDSELVGSGLGPSEISALVIPGRCLRLLMGETRLGPVIWHAVESAIPASVRGSFAPAEPGIVLGEHDLFETSEHTHGHLFGRPLFSFSVFGYGTPNDWSLFRKLVFDLPLVQQLEQQISAFAGPMQRCVFWDV